MHLLATCFSFSITGQPSPYAWEMYSLCFLQDHVCHDSQSFISVGLADLSFTFGHLLEIWVLGVLIMTVGISGSPRVFCMCSLCCSGAPVLYWIALLTLRTIKGVFDGRNNTINRACNSEHLLSFKLWKHNDFLFFTNVSKCVK